MISHSRSYIGVFVALLLLLPSTTRAATLKLSPTSASIAVGTSITATIFASSADQALNAVSGVLSFPMDLLQVVSVSKVSSLLSLWVVDPTFSNIDGTISWSGIVPNPGYIGSSGRIFSIQFRGKKVGTAKVTFSSISQVLANDGNGTDILTGTQPATITIVLAQPQLESPAVPPPVTSSNTDLLANIVSSTHPDQTQWYKLSHAVFDWTNAQGVSAVRLGYDKDADGKPSVLYSDPVSHKELDLGDGIWYFHVQEKDASGWGPISTYKVQIDTVAPFPFALAFPNGTTTVQFNATIPVQFTAQDALSGIDHYRFSLDGKESTVSAEEGGRPYAVPSGDLGIHVLAVQAYDKAGNVRSAEGKFTAVGKVSSQSPLFTFGWLAVNYLSIILVVLAILGMLLFGAWYIRVHFSAYRHRLNHKLGVTQARIHKEFDALRDALVEEILRLEQVKSARELTREEERLIARFRKLLERSEQAIEKDIEEVSQ